MRKYAPKMKGKNARSNANHLPPKERIILAVII
jgi:hypothetical protein